MKDSSLAVSLGLAAIDGLTCAFIAILILAFILIGAGIASNASDANQSRILMIHIGNTADNTAPLDPHLLIDIGTDATMQHTSAFTVQSNGQLMRLTSVGKLVRPGSAVWWKDCQAVGGIECSAMLFVTRIRKGQLPWYIRLRVGDAGDSFTSKVVSYDLWMQLDQGPRLEHLALTPDSQRIVCANWDTSAVTACVP